MTHDLSYRSGALTIKAATKNYVTISGYASVFGAIDSHNDIILQGAFGAAKHKNIKFLWQHDQMRPIGVVMSAESDEYGLYVECNINNATELGREAVALIEQGAINGLSIGFTTKHSQYNQSGQREITEAHLHEVSIVTFPANSDAQISRISNALNIAHKAIGQMRHC